MNTSNIVFFGTPPFAVSILEALLGSGRKVSLVVTQPDRPAGRGQVLKASAVKEFSLRENIPIFQPTKMKDPHFHELLKKTESKLFVVAAFGRILPRALLEIPTLTLNVHASLLPRWRGASPIERAILQGDEKTGVSIMRMVEGLDAGDVLLKSETRIKDNETTFELENRLASIGGVALIQALDLLSQGKGEFVPQNEAEVTLAPPIQVEEAKINWSRSAKEVHNQIRGFNPWPGAFSTLQNFRFKIYHSQLTAEPCAGVLPGSLKIEKGRLMAACKDGWLEILELQREGKKRQTAKVFLAGFRASNTDRWI